MSRRRIFSHAIAAAAVGATTATVFDDLTSGRALAATTTEPGAVAPAVVFLTDAATIAVDASQGNDFRVTAAASRTMGNPANPTDGQQILFHVTQGASGSALITWGSGYEFSASLPQPTLSTQPGETDLVGFVYNLAIGSWLNNLFVRGFAGASVTPSPTPTATATPTPTPSPSPSPSGGYRLFPSTNGPTALSSYSGTFAPGVVFEVTGAAWFEGYWWWVAPSGQSTAPQQFALWSMYSGSAGALVPGATVTSGQLVAGQWNYVPLPAPVALTIGTSNGAQSGSAAYIASTSFTGNFPQTASQFGSGEAYAAGIVAGPLVGYSDSTGSQPSIFSLNQGLFGVTSCTSSPPTSGYESSNFWIDLQVSTTPPTSASYRIWPSYPVIPGSISIDTGQQTFGTEFWLSQSCSLDNIWFYSPSGAGALPSRCGIFSVSTQTEVSGTDNSSPNWLTAPGKTASPGAGWVYCSYSSAGVTLAAGKYKVCVYSGGGTEFYQENIDYFSAGPGRSNIVNGPLTCPSTANAAAPGQSSYQDGAWSYPDSFDNKDDGENRWVDVEVTPTS